MKKRQIITAKAVLIFLTSVVVCPCVIADEPTDAKIPDPTDLTDLSCWMAVGANMMAADGWGNAQAIYNYLRNTYGGTTNSWMNGGDPTQAINWVNTHRDGFLNDLDELILANNASTNARQWIDYLLHTNTATDLPGDQFPEGPDDPVGILFHYYDTNFNETVSHSTRRWRGGTNGLTVTDSSATNGPFTLTWVDNSHFTYDGFTATIDGERFMADTVPEPNTPCFLLTGFAGLLLTFNYRRRQWRALSKRL